MSIYQKLGQYYHNNKIQAKDFKCNNGKKCEVEIGAQEDFIGKHYEITVPKILIIGQEPNTLDKIAYHRDMKHRRMGIEKGARDAKKGKNKHNRHWKETLEIVMHLLKPYSRSIIDINDVVYYFAATNVVRCQAKNSSRFKNCAGYIPKVLEILSPHVVITQGNDAKNAINGSSYQVSSMQIPHKNRAQDWEIIKIGNKDTLWINTYHPTVHGPQYTNNSYRSKKRINYYSQLISEFLKAINCTHCV